jgi:hypothetical protein
MLSSIMLFALQVSNLTTAEPTCRPVDSAVVRQHATKIIEHPDSPEATLNYSALVEYWRSQCASSRYNASEDTVRALSLLLRSPLDISGASRMLYEIGDNLGHAIPALEEALEKEILFRQNLRDEQMRARPFVALYSSGLSDGPINDLRCILNKARTGTCDAALCEDIAEANNGDNN